MIVGQRKLPVKFTVEFSGIANRAKLYLCMWLYGATAKGWKENTMLSKSSDKVGLKLVTTTSLSEPILLKTFSTVVWSTGYQCWISKFNNCFLL